MALKSRVTLKTYFETGDKPTQAQFADWLDSFFHKDDSISVNNIAGLGDMLTELALNSDLSNHINDDVAHVTQANRDAWDAKADLNAVYTQDAVNNLLDAKADLNSVYTQDQADALLANKSDNGHGHAGHIHVAEMKVSPTGADEEADSFRLRQNGSETILESTADGAVWTVLAVWER